MIPLQVSGVMMRLPKAQRRLGARVDAVNRAEEELRQAKRLCDLLAGSAAHGLAEQERESAAARLSEAKAAYYAELEAGRSDRRAA